MHVQGTLPLRGENGRFLGFASAAVVRPAMRPTSRSVRRKPHVRAVQPMLAVFAVRPCPNCGRVYCVCPRSGW